MKKEHLNFIRELFLFMGVGSDEIERMVGNYSFSVTEFAKGEVIYSPDSFQKKIGFVYRASCISSAITHVISRLTPDCEAFCS